MQQINLAFSSPLTSFSTVVSSRRPPIMVFNLNDTYSMSQLM